MLSKLIIDPNLNSQQETVDKLLTEFELTKNHPDLLWIESQEDKALGVKEAKSVRKHFSFKPLNSKVKIAVIIGADTLSIDAQNSLLKILEEPPANAGLILTATSESNLLPTILSRCQISREGSQIKKMDGKNHYYLEIEKLFSADLGKRFELVEALGDKEEFLEAFNVYLGEKLPENPKLLEAAKKLLQADKWQKSQGNIRAILEFLALNLD